MKYATAAFSLLALTAATLISAADKPAKKAEVPQANIFRKFDVPNDQPVVVLQGVLAGGTVTFSGDGWKHKRGY